MLKSQSSFRNLMAGFSLCAFLSVMYYGLRMENTIETNPQDSFTRKKEPESSKQHPFDKWIVVTSISSPTKDIQYLSQLPGWRVVVVGDVKSPKNWSHPNCDFLSIERQQSLNFKIFDSLPYKSYARKNIGYLYAILNGAKFIYETDDDNRPTDNLSGFIYSPETSGLMYAGKHVFNPYHHFGQSTLWPRGYPLSEIGVINNRTYWLSNEWTTPTIQQGIVNGDPDMDAIFRLTRKSVTSPLNVTFDPCAPPVFVPQGVFSPFNSQNTLFHYRAFWAMLIPTTTTFRMCDIWRGYWAQRLMWEIGDRLAFFPANAYQNRSAHSYMEDAEDEKDMYFQTETLISFLTNWSCPSSVTFFQCAMKLTSDMADRKYWKHEEIEVTQLWLEDLLDLGYPEPYRIIEVTTLSENETLNITSYHDLHEDNFKQRKIRSTVTFFPVEQEAPVIAKDIDRKSSTQKAFNDMSSICPNIMKTSWIIEKDAFSKYYFDVLLIVVFNWPRHYGHVRFIDALYSQIFPNILYCGDNLSIFLNQTNSLGKRFSFLEVSMEGGYVGYLCAIKAMEMNYRVRGFLFLGDDVLFKHWSFFNVSKDDFWVTTEPGNFLINITNPGHGWYWWPRSNGKAAFDKTVMELRSTVAFPQNVINETTFFDNLANYTGLPNFTVYGFSDMYYIPARRRLDTIWYMSQFYRNKLFLEIAVPTVVRGVERRYHVAPINGLSLWGGGRHNPFRLYHSIVSFFHPLKFSDSSTFSEMCKLFVPDILRHSFGYRPINNSLF